MVYALLGKREQAPDGVVPLRGFLSKDKEFGFRRKINSNFEPLRVGDATELLRGTTSLIAIASICPVVSGSHTYIY